MTGRTWMIYGAYGYTGRLVAQEALQRGHRPVLAGRSAGPLQALGAELGLPTRVCDLDDHRGLVQALQGVDAVVHTAGPFAHTSTAMVRACHEAGAHYLDVTGEIEVFQHTMAQDAAAKERGVSLISGVGFDVVPTDCLAVYVADQVPGATQLELAIKGLATISAGTAKSTFEGALRGGLWRRDGQLQPLAFGRGVREQRFPGGRTYPVMPIPWGDLETAFHSTGIPNITTLMAVPPQLAQVASRTAWLSEYGLPLIRPLLERGPLHDAIMKRLSQLPGPDEAARRSGHCYVWARAENAAGQSCEAWLTTAEGYAFTGMAAVRSLEQVLARNPSGALTPAMAFGAGFVLDIPGSVRHEQLDS